MKLTSVVFTHQANIPSRYTCDGENISPPLNWTGTPANARSLVLIMDDPDAPRGTWDHWIIFNLPVNINSLPEGAKRFPVGTKLAKIQKSLQLKAEETKRLGREQERILKANRDKDSQLRAFRESLWSEVKNYYWASSEARDGTRNPNLTSGGYLRDWLNSYPNLQFNLVGGDQYSCNWTNNSWKTTMQAFTGLRVIILLLNSSSISKITKWKS